jgi:hypothetical protein
VPGSAAALQYCHAYSVSDTADSDSCYVLVTSDASQANAVALGDSSTGKSCFNVDGTYSAAAFFGKANTVKTKAAESTLATTRTAVETAMDS